jgi:hypothetical protein
MFSDDFAERDQNLITFLATLLMQYEEPTWLGFSFVFTGFWFAGGVEKAKRESMEQKSIFMLKFMNGTSL